jgi:DNA-binding NarL/FixJ family response regulator
VHVQVRVLFAKLGASMRTAAAHGASLLNLF